MILEAIFRSFRTHVQLVLALFLLVYFTIFTKEFNTNITGLVNINFGTHTCVHMGTVLRSSESAYPPTAISYPLESAETNQLHTIIMVDLDHEKTNGKLAQLFLFVHETLDRKFRA